MEDHHTENHRAPAAAQTSVTHIEARHDNDEDEVAETDPEGRYYRYTEVVGKGRFKQIFKAFDTNMGIDVAWSKISADSNQLNMQQISAIVEESKKGLALEHPNIIKCFKCWEDPGNHCINLITELFTSGNLRQYRNLHKQLDLKAVKRMARQILKGLEYLHSMEPPVTHGDLRCDKIYVNGHSGEIKIGDLGLATLLPKRWENGNCSPMLLTTAMPSDIFAFGLCMLELLTLEQLDPQHCGNWREYLPSVQDEDARTFIAKCLGPPGERPSAMDLLDDPFLSLRKAPTSADTKAEESIASDVANLKLEKRRTDDNDDGSAPISIGKLRGEDYNFEFHGKVKDGKMHFRLVMQQESDSSTPPLVRTIDFVFDPEVDTADNLASEIADEFSLSTTDTEICAAALKEWLAKEMPGSEGSK